jgi:hypothetical protein
VPAKALALRHAGHVDEVALGEDVADGDLLADVEVVDAVQPELADGSAPGGGP